MTSAPQGVNQQQQKRQNRPKETPSPPSANENVILKPAAKAAPTAQPVKVSAKPSPAQSTSNTAKGAVSSTKGGVAPSTPSQEQSQSVGHRRLVRQSLSQPPPVERSTPCPSGTPAVVTDGAGPAPAPSEPQPQRPAHRPPNDASMSVPPDGSVPSPSSDEEMQVDRSLGTEETEEL